MFDFQQRIWEVYIHVIDPMGHGLPACAIRNRLIQEIGEAGVVEFMPRMEGANLAAIPVAAKKQAATKPAAPPAG